jgi:hypothetical protein
MAYSRGQQIATGREHRRTMPAGLSGEGFMNNDLNVQQSGKAGGDGFGWSASGSTGTGGAGTAEASSFGGLLGDAQGQAAGGNGFSASSSGGAFGGDVSDNTAIGSINISF